MSLPRIRPAEALRLLQQGATLVDIREADEHAREKIIGAHHLPLSKLDEANLALHEGKPIIFHCKSGARTVGNTSRLVQKVSGSCEAFVIEGGLDACHVGALEQDDLRHPGARQGRLTIAAVLEQLRWY
jgi:rhodanese-related sulfurtransferase